MNLGFWGKLNPARTGKPIMVCSPMSGVTDEAFRLMLLKYGKPSVFWTEFVSAEGLFSRGREYCLKILKFRGKPDKSQRHFDGPATIPALRGLGGEHPIVAQLFGSDPVYFEKAAAEMAKLGFDGIDINMGCPDKAIEKQGAGACLIKNPALAKEIIRATKKGAGLPGQGKLPVSVKTRIGYAKNEISTWIKAILEEKPAALTVHFRTREEKYFGPAHWELAKGIVKLKNKVSPRTLILGNGDVKSFAQAYKLAKENGLDGIMVGRAIVGDPWFFAGEKPDVAERLGAVVEHAEVFSSLGGHFESMKKHFHEYTKGFRGAKKLREQLMKVKNATETRKVIEEFLI